MPICDQERVSFTWNERQIPWFDFYITHENTSNLIGALERYSARTEEDGWSHAAYREINCLGMYTRDLCPDAFVEVFYVSLAFHRLLEEKETKAKVEAIARLRHIRDLLYLDELFGQAKFVRPIGVES